MTVLLPLALSMACQTYKAECTCFPAVPFEGYQMYVVEKCDASQEWYKYGQQQYTTEAECKLAIEADVNCQSLNTDK